MNKKIAAVVVILVLAVNSLFALTATNKVAVLYNRGTQVNRRVLHFMGSQFYSLGSQYKFYAVGNPNNIKPNTYKAILVLSTGVRTGIDPILAKFIDSWKNKSEIILISLLRDSNNMKVETIPSSGNALGVDAVTAATSWGRAGLVSIFGNNSDPRQMHTEWVSQVLDLLSKKG